MMFDNYPLVRLFSCIILVNISVRTAALAGIAQTNLWFDPRARMQLLGKVEPMSKSPVATLAWWSASTAGTLAGALWAVQFKPLPTIVVLLCELQCIVVFYAGQPFMIQFVMELHYQKRLQNGEPSDDALFHAKHDVEEQLTKPISKTAARALISAAKDIRAPYNYK